MIALSIFERVHSLEEKERTRTMKRKGSDGLVILIGGGSEG